MFKESEKYMYTTIPEKILSPVVKFTEKINSYTHRKHSDMVTIKLLTNYI